VQALRVSVMTIVPGTALFFAAMPATTYGQLFDPCASYRSLIVGTPLKTDLGYRPRGQKGQPDRRCEGLYEANRTAGDLLTLFSLTMGRISLDADKVDTIPLQLPASAVKQAGPFSVRVSSTIGDQHYQMDTVIGADATAPWPTEVLRRLGAVPSDKVGAVAWVEDKHGKLFAPIVVGKAADQPANIKKLILTIVVPTSIAQLRWRQGRVAGAADVECAASKDYEFRNDVVSLRPYSIDIAHDPKQLACLEFGVRRQVDSAWRQEIVRILMPQL
jgi:hypothetical protein